MADIRAKIVLLGLIASSLCTGGFAQQQDLSQPPILPSLGPSIPPHIVFFPEPPPVPSPPDAPIPDLGAITGPPDKSHSVIKRALDRAKPNCLDAIIHTCWSSPPGDGLSKEDREFAQDMEMGKYHFRNKNYRGAMFRYQHALNLKPGQPEATFRLAETLDKLGNMEEARDGYEAYLEIQSSGAHADKARAALEQLKSAKPK